MEPHIIFNIKQSIFSDFFPPPSLPLSLFSCLQILHKSIQSFLFICPSHAHLHVFAPTHYLLSISNEIQRSHRRGSLRPLTANISMLDSSTSGYYCWQRGGILLWDWADATEYVWTFHHHSPVGHAYYSWQMEKIGNKSKWSIHKSQFAPRNTQWGRILIWQVFFNMLRLMSLLFFSLNSQNVVDEKYLIWLAVVTLFF